MYVDGDSSPKARHVQIHGEDVHEYEIDFSFNYGPDPWKLPGGDNLRSF
jgi:hypothetical protein